MTTGRINQVVRSHTGATQSVGMGRRSPDSHPAPSPRASFVALLVVTPRKVQMYREHHCFSTAIAQHTAEHCNAPHNPYKFVHRQKHPLPHTEGQRSRMQHNHTVRPRLSEEMHDVMRAFLRPPSSTSVRRSAYISHSIFG